MMHHGMEYRIVHGKNRSMKRRGVEQGETGVEEKREYDMKY